MWMWHSGWGWFWMSITMIVFWALVAWVIVTLVRQGTVADPGRATRNRYSMRGSRAARSTTTSISDGAT